MLHQPPAKSAQKATNAQMALLHPLNAQWVPMLPWAVLSVLHVWRVMTVLQQWGLL